MDNKTDNTGDIIIYQTEDGLTKINVKLDNETVWLSQQQLAELYQTSRTNALEHKPMYMSDYIRQLDSVLTSGNRPLLEGSGSVSHAQALEKATTEYRKYQNNTLSPVEEAYLETVKATAKLVKKKTKGKK